MPFRDDREALVERVSSLERDLTEAKAGADRAAARELLRGLVCEDPNAADETRELRRQIERLERTNARTLAACATLLVLAVTGGFVALRWMRPEPAAHVGDPLPRLDLETLDHAERVSTATLLGRHGALVFFEGSDEDAESVLVLARALARLRPRPFLILAIGPRSTLSVDELADGLDPSCGEVRIVAADGVLGPALGVTHYPRVLGIDDAGVVRFDHDTLDASVVHDVEAIAPLP